MKSEMGKGLPNRIRECAKSVGGGDALAKRTGIKRRTLENYLGGYSEPKASGIIAIAEAAGVSTDWILKGEGSIRRPETPASIEDVFADSLFIDVTEWGIAWAQKNKFEIVPENFGRMLIKCYDTVSQEKKRNPSSSATELRRFLENFLEVAILLNR